MDRSTWPPQHQLSPREQGVLAGALYVQRGFLAPSGPDPAWITQLCNRDQVRFLANGMTPSRTVWASLDYWLSADKAYQDYREGFIDGLENARMVFLEATYGPST